MRWSILHLHRIRHKKVANDAHFDTRISCLVVSKRAYILGWFKDALRKQFPEIYWKYQVENITQVIELLYSEHPPELIIAEDIFVKEIQGALPSNIQASDVICIGVNPANVQQPVPPLVKLPTLCAKPSPLLIKGLKCGLAKVYLKRGAILPGSYKSGSIRFEDLMYIRGEGSYSRFFLVQNMEVLASRPIGFFQCRLPDHRFVRIHKSLIVNLDFVKHPKSDSWEFLSLADHQTSLPISLRRMKKLKSLLVKGK